MEKVVFHDPDTQEKTEFFVEEETKVNGTRYLFVTENDKEDCNAYILKEVAAENEEAVYEMVDDETELMAIGRVFAELMEDVDIAYEE